MGFGKNSVLDKSSEDRGMGFPKHSVLAGGTMRPSPRHPDHKLGGPSNHQTLKRQSKGKGGEGGKFVFSQKQRDQYLCAL